VPGKLGLKASRFLVRAIWFFLGLWVSLGVLFTLPGPRWSSTIAALLVAGTFYLAISRRRIYPALSITLVFGIYYLGFIKPDPDLNWAPDHARKPSVELQGDLVTVRNVRDFEWRSGTDFTPRYNDKTYDLRKLDSMHYIVAPIRGTQAVAHVFLAFGFSDGQTLSISVEGRREEGKPYQVIPSLFRQYQLIYVVGEERDVVGLRGALWKAPVQFYPVRSTQERKRALL
jgi:hypothetical protein